MVRPGTPVEAAGTAARHKGHRTGCLGRARFRYAAPILGLLGLWAAPQGARGQQASEATLPKVGVHKAVTNLNGDPTGATARWGDTLQYSVRITNEGSVDVLEVAGADLLPEFGDFASGSLEVTEGPGMGFRTDSPDDGDLGGFDPSKAENGEVLVFLGPIEDWGLLKPGQSVAFRFRVVVDRAAPIGTILANRGIGRYQNVDHEDLRARSPWVYTEVIGPEPNVSLAKHVTNLNGDPSGETGRRGDTLQYSVRVTNHGPADIIELNGVDVLPEHGGFVSGSLVITEGPVVGQVTDAIDDGDAGGIDLTRPPSGEVRVRLGVTEDWNRLEPGESTAFSFRVVISEEAPIGSVLENRGTARYATEAYDPRVKRSNRVQTVVVDDPVDLELLVEAVGERFVRGRAEVYRVTVGNVGHRVASGARVLQDIDPSLSVLGVTGEGWSLIDTSPGPDGSTRLAVVYGGAIAPTENRHFDVMVSVGAEAPDTVSSRGQVFHPLDDIPGNNVSIVDTPVSDGFRLALFKRTVGAFAQGQPGTFEIEVRNAGEVDADVELTVVDELPEGLTYLGGEGMDWEITASPDGRTVTALRTSTLAGNATSAFQLTVDVARTATCQFNNVAVLTTSHGLGTAGAIEAETGPVSYFCGELALGKTAEEPDLERTDLAHYTLVVKNMGTVGLNTVQVADQLPPGFSYAPSSLSGASLVEQLVDGVRGSLLFEVAPIAAGDSLTFRYSARVGPGTAIGPATNTASAVDLETGVQSPIARAEVVVREGFFDEGLILGKVSAHCEACEGPGQPGDPDLGIPGVRIYLQDGTSAVTDSEGKYSFYGLRPRSWVVRVDPGTVPPGTGFQALTNRHRANGLTQFVDLTRGELARADFVAQMDTLDAANWIATQERRTAQRDGADARSSADSPEFQTLAPQNFDDTFHPFDPGPDSLRLFRGPTDGQVDPEADTDTSLGAASGPTVDPTQESVAEETPRRFGLGVLEGRLDLRSLTNAELAVTRNAFEDELTGLSFESDDGKTSGGARLSAFFNGDLTDSTKVAFRVETEEESEKRFFRDIRPEDLYGIYGDASARRYEAQSRGRFFGRVENGGSYLQWGDFSTAWSLDQSQQLGRYVRTLSGLSQHVETDWLRLDGFASRERFSQVVDELPALGISGPYELSRTGGLINSERVEILTRDRNQPSRIIRVELLERFLDYTLEPFTGRLLLKSPVPSLDEALNPRSLRIIYEVEQDADPFWVVGVDARAQPTGQVEVGGGYTRDNNPIGRYDLATVNATIALPNNTFLLGEWARSDSVGTQSGGAGRAELQHRSERLSARAYFQKVDSTFANASAGFLRGRRENVGREELGLSATGLLTPTTSASLGALRTESLFNGGVRQGMQVEVDRRIRESWSLAFGFRWAEETAAPASGRAEGVGPYDFSTLRGRLTAFGDGPRPAKAFLEYEQDVSDADRRRLFVGGDVRIGKARAYGRHELISSLEGPYALNAFDEQNNTVLGVSADAVAGSSVYSEYRIRDAISGREAQAAVGLRNRWRLRPGLAVSTSFERVDPLVDN
ncbi:MAG: hypothetical protein ACR2QM_17610, partial [Longimicrobiales bacterium]